MLGVGVVGHRVGVLKLPFYVGFMFVRQVIHDVALFGDLDRLEVRGTPVPLLEDVAGDPFTAGGQFDVSRNGTFVYLGGKSSGAA